MRRRSNGKHSLRSATISGRIDYERALKLARRNLEANLPEALELLRRAVSCGYGAAEYALATWYLFGVGVGKNRVKAAALLKKAVANGVAEAAFDLAVCFERGRGVPKDSRAAFRMYMKAVRLGDYQSEYEVARCYKWGIGVSKNLVRMEYWFARARHHKVQEALKDARKI